MPLKDKEARLAYQRKWYAEHNKRVIAKVRERKQTLYGGTCKNCGGPTIGQSKNDIPEWCGKPDCKSAQHRANREVFAQAGRKVKVTQKAERERKLWLEQERPIVSIDEVIKEL